MASTQLITVRVNGDLLVFHHVKEYIRLCICRTAVGANTSSHHDCIHATHATNSAITDAEAHPAGCLCVFYSFSEIFRESFLPSILSFSVIFLKHLRHLPRLFRKDRKKCAMRNV